MSLKQVFSFQRRRRNIGGFPKERSQCGVPLNACSVVSVVVLMLFGLSGCQSQNQGTEMDGNDTAGADVTIMGESDELLEQAVDSARRDLAENLGVPVDGMVVQEASRVTWRDSSLGCPEPGRMYTQAVVPGVLVRLVVDGREYRYHGGENGQMFHCPSHRLRTGTEKAVQ